MSLTKLEKNYLVNEFYWVDELEYTQNIPSFLELRSFLLENGWKEEVKNEYVEFKEDENAIPYYIFHEFTKELKYEVKKEIKVIKSESTQYAHLWYADPVNGSSGDGSFSNFLNHHQELPDRHSIFEEYATN